MATKQPSERTLHSELLGREVQFNYSETWLAYSMVGLRIVIAWVFLQAGLSKLFEGGVGEPLAWSSAGFLENAIAATNPLQGLFLFFADYAAIIDPMVIFGQILIGLALLFGVLFRFAALMGAIQMAFFWTAAWQGGVAAGLPMENGYVIDSSFVYRWYRASASGLDPEGEARHQLHQTLSNHVSFYVVTTRNNPLKV